MSIRPEPEAGAAAEPPMLGSGDRLAALIARGPDLLSVTCIALMLIMTATNVIGRYLLNAPFRGAEELTGFLIVATLIFGAAEAHQCSEHIAVDLLEASASRRARWLQAEVARIIVTVTIAWTGWETVTLSRSFGVYPPGYMQMPMWTVQLPLVIGGVVLAIVAALKLISLLRRRHP